VSHHRIASRPHVQGSSAPLRLRHSGHSLTDGSGLVLLRRVWDGLDLGRWLDREAAGLGGFYRPSLMVELWVALLLYGGERLDDLALLSSRSVRRLFGWVAVPDPTTFGRWLRRGGAPMGAILDRLLWRLVAARWRSDPPPASLTVVVDSTVVVRYGTRQAGAARGYNPKKPGRPSHHPLVAFTAETGDCLGVLWRPGNAYAATGAEAWIEILVGRLRALGVEAITVRLDKGFFSKSMVATLERLGVDYLLKVPAHAWVRARLEPWRGVATDPAMEQAEGVLWSTRLVAVRRWKDTPVDPDQPELWPETRHVAMSALILTNLEGIQPLTAWRRYNAGAVVEQRIEELGQLGIGATAIDDLGGNALLWALGALAYQLFHVMRREMFTGSWKVAQPRRIRLWVFRLAGKLTRHGRKNYLQLVGDHPWRTRLLAALRATRTLQPLPT